MRFGEYLKSKRKKKTLAFISTHDPNNPNIFPFIKKSFGLFREVRSLEHYIKYIKLINNKRQAPSLQQLLCNSKFSSLGGTNFGTKNVERIASAVTIF